jgi:hypothetical protein
MYSGLVTEAALTALIARVAQSGFVYELGMHPGHPARRDERIYARRGYNEFISSPSREAEYRLLTDARMKSLVAECGIQLMSYGDLATSQEVGATQKDVEIGGEDSVSRPTAAREARGRLLL